jgi:hypothetical protein
LRRDVRALLSATSRKQKAKGATGGLLRKLGNHGILVIKDVTSILSAASLPIPFAGFVTVRQLLFVESMVEKTAAFRQRRAADTARWRERLHRGAAAGPLVKGCGSVRMP